MSAFALLLLSVFCLFTLICIGLSMLTWLYYRRKTEFEVEARNLREYRYFIQPFFRPDESMISCELILREFDHKNKEWIAPYNIKHFPLDRLIIAVKDIQSLIPGDTNSISINMTVSQCVDYQAEYFFKWIIGILDNQKLNVEINADELMHLNGWQQHRMKKILLKMDELGILVTIRNIGSEEEYYRELSPYAFFIDHYCISAHRFNPHKTLLMKKWQMLAQKYQKPLVLTGIDNIQTNNFADKFNIKIRQGFYYSNPAPVRSMAQEIVE